MLQFIWRWLQAHDLLLFYLGLFSIITFVISTFIVPLLIISLPCDYLTNENSARRFYKMPVPLLTVLLILKNLLGVLFIMTGIILLILPGQGLLTILLGVLLLDFPYKRQIELKVIGGERILNVINWMRKKFGKEPLLAPRVEDKKN